LKRTLLDLYGAWILFFHYVKWPILVGLPILYLEMGYERNIVMDIVWVYCLYLALEALYRRYILKQRCSSKGCETDTRKD